MPRGGSRPGAGRKRTKVQVDTVARETPTRATPDQKQSRPRARVSTSRAQAAFLREYALCGNVLRACQAAKVARATLYGNWVKRPEFKALFDQVAEDAIDLLEEEARRRAVDGVDEPVFHKGDQCGVIRKYSDTLLITLLKARRPLTFRDHVDHKHSGTVTLEQVLDASRSDGASA